MATLIVLAVFLGFFAYSPGFSKVSEPYTAKTSDECVKEKACAWYLFQGMATRVKIPMQYLPTYMHLIKKWEGPIGIGFRTPDTNKQKYYDLLDKYAKQIDGVIPNKVSIPGQTRIFVFFSEDFKHDIEVTYRDEAYDFFINHMGKEGLEKVLETYSQCFSYYITDQADNQIKMAVIFANPQGDLYKCVGSQLLSVLGLDSNTKEFPFSITGPNHSSFTGVDLFMLHLLYSEDIKKKMSLAELALVFDRIYPEKVKFFERITRSGNR